MTKPGNLLTDASPTAQRLYRALLKALRAVGPFEEEVKKTSVHLVRNVAFAGVRVRREYLIITIKSATPVNSPRVSKSEQTSKNRWHCEVTIAKAADLDRQLIAWLRAAYQLRA